MSVYFSSNSLCNHRFTSSGWTVKKNSFWRVNSESSEQFRMLQRKFNHFANFLQLLANSTNVLVGDSFRLSDVFIVNRFVFDDDIGIAGDFHDSFWSGLNNCKWQCFSKQCHAWNEDSITGHNWPLRKASASKAFDTGAELHLLLVCHYWGKCKFRTFLCLGFDDIDSIA